MVAKSCTWRVLVVLLLSLVILAPAGGCSGSDSSNNSCDPKDGDTTCLLKGAMRCDAKTKTCVAKKSCTSHSECSDGFACGIDSCYRNCADITGITNGDGWCQKGYKCQANYTCALGTTADGGVDKGTPDKGTADQGGDGPPVYPDVSSPEMSLPDTGPDLWPQFDAGR